MRQVDAPAADRGAGGDDGGLDRDRRPRRHRRGPLNLFVAAFIGSPAINLVEARVEDGRVAFGGHRIPLEAPAPEGDVILGIRPESFEDASFADPSLPQLDAEVAVLEDLGADAHVLFPVDAPRVDAEELREARADEDAVLLASAGTVFTARIDPRSDARPGRAVRLAVDPAASTSST